MVMNGFETNETHHHTLIAEAIVQCVIDRLEDKIEIGNV